MIVSSRGLEEYVAMFGLDDAVLDSRVLDCAAGAGGFAAQLAAQRPGSRVVACDPAYALTADALRAAVAAGTATAEAMLRDHPDRFTWQWYGNPAHRQQLRDAAAAASAADRAAPAAPNARYVAAALPRLPFRTGTFDLALVSHLLFTWTTAFDETWHRAAVAELLRVAGEVRVFPLVRAADAAPVAFLGPLLDDLRAAGVHADVRRVPYEFQVGADQLLVLRR